MRNLIPTNIYRTFFVVAERFTKSAGGRQKGRQGKGQKPHISLYTLHGFTKLQWEGIEKFPKEWYASEGKWG